MWDGEMPRVRWNFSENTLFSLLFADDFVGVAKTVSALQKLIDNVHNYNKCGVLKPM